MYVCKTTQMGAMPDKWNGQTIMEMANIRCWNQREPKCDIYDTKYWTLIFNK